MKLPILTLTRTLTLALALCGPAPLLRGPVLASEDAPQPPEKPVLDGDKAEKPDPTPGQTQMPDTKPESPLPEASNVPVPTGGPPFEPAAAMACEAELGRKGVKFRLLDPIKEDNGCGAQRPLLVETLGRGITLSAGITARCDLVLALATWAQDTVLPAAKLHLDAELTAIAIGTSYQCRRRNNVATGKFSEHAFANGLDLMEFRFKTRPPLGIKARDGMATPDRAFQAAARGAACAYFTTVLGPGTNATHHDHLHVDMAFRSGGYRLCQ